MGVTSTHDVTGKQLLLLQRQCESLEMIGSTPQGHTCLDLLWHPRKAGKIWECWQVQPIVGGVRNGDAEEGWRWDLNPGMAAVGGRTTWLWGSLCPKASEAGETLWGRKRVKGLLLLGQHKCHAGLD